MHPEDVKRVVLNGEERLLFNFNNIVQYENETICDISMGLIDGTGKAYETEFEVSKIIWKYGTKGKIKNAKSTRIL